MLWRVGWLVIWDQLPRNVHRGSASAYAFDPSARALAEALLPHWEDLPAPMRVSVVLAYIHSEDVSDVRRVEDLLEQLSGPMAHFPEVWASLKGIAGNHRDRMLAFGRVPERNVYLGRPTTEEERVWMANVRTTL